MCCWILNRALFILLDPHLLDLEWLMKQTFYLRIIMCILNMFFYWGFSSFHEVFSSLCENQAESQLARTVYKFKRTWVQIVGLSLPLCVILRLASNSCQWLLWTESQIVSLAPLNNYTSAFEKEWAIFGVPEKGKCGWKTGGRSRLAVFHRTPLKSLEFYTACIF